MSSLGLYLHIPFCASICNYCNFNRGLVHPELKRRYVAALEREIRDQDRGPLVADTIFFGGGTPSLLEPADVARLVSTCRESFVVAPDAEVTLEINPEGADEERLAGFLAAGVTRLSFGVQSFRDDELRRLGRAHDAARARAAVTLARAAGFENLSLDLMMWLPQQSLAQWDESVRALIAVAPDHASLYLLELYPNAPLRDEMARAGWSLAPDEDAAEMYLSALSALEAAGYQPYEISNVARAGKQCRHNVKYWSDGEWLGFGCGAHSTYGDVRWKNVSSTDDYICRVAAGGTVAVERRELSATEHLQEAVFTGLRLYEGVDLGALGRRYGIDIWEEYGDRLGPYMEAELLVHEGDCLRLTRRGMLLANEVMAVFV